MASERPHSSDPGCAADKVTIEAKSPHAGTITKIYVDIGQTVEVGGPFFAIAVGEGEATAAAAPAAAAAAPAADAAPTAAPTVSAAASASGATRVHPSGKPSLICFPPRGKLAVLAAQAAAAQAAAGPSAASAPKAAAPRAPPPAGTIAYEDLPARFRRPAISEEEMEAIMSGGATQTWGR